VTGIATARHGLATDERGLDLERCLRESRAGGSLAGLQRGRAPRTSLEFVRTVPADVLVEITPQDPERGEPATTHVREALRRGLHVVTANKGPVAFALRRLRALAQRQGRLFLYESAVMDGTPVFNLKARCLRGARILGFRGTLNATSNHILAELEQGRPFAVALREAQRLGIAEADPRHDLAGWDSALKGCALANALMDASVKPGDVRRRGILALTAKQARSALRRGRRLRLVVRGRRQARRVHVSVRPEEVPLGDPLALAGPDSVLLLETDVMGTIGVIERGMSVDQTAYGLLSDLLQVAGAVQA
jgi:homoserine dehydrogenase